MASGIGIAKVNRIAKIAGGFFEFSSPVTLLEPTQTTHTSLYATAKSLYVDDNFLMVGDTGFNDGAANGGYTYIYDTATNTIQAEKNATTTGAAYDFGAGLVATDSYYAIGAVDADTGLANAGSVAIYDSSTDAFIEEMTQPSSGNDNRGVALTPTSGDEFGINLASSANYFLVSDRNYYNGIIHLYDKATRTRIWSQRSPTYSNGTTEVLPTAAWGNGPAIIDESTSRVYVGVPGSYGESGGTGNTGSVFHLNLLTGATLGYNQLDTGTGGTYEYAKYYGYTLAQTGSRLVVGNYNASSSNGGQVFVIEKTNYYNSSSTFNFTQFNAPNFEIANPYSSVSSGDRFGRFVAANENYIAVSYTGLYNGTYGTIAIFKASNYKHVGNIYSGLGSEQGFGSSIGLNSNNQLYVGCPDYVGTGQTGAVFYYELP